MYGLSFQLNEVKIMYMNFYLELLNLYHFRTY